ncbi:MAG: acetate kinase [Coriobacteriia bacterium]|nr:acetate kinase [Coriobacteriia bacterium]
MNVLVLNAGSSSLKYQLFNMQTGEVSAKGVCDRVGTTEALHVYEAGEVEQEEQLSLLNHLEAIKAAVAALTHPHHGVIQDLSEINAIGHRVVHGGDYFVESVVIDDEVIARIEECVGLAPLHNPAGLAGIRACVELMEGTPQVAVFDTSFHQTMPAKAYRYPLPTKYFEDLKIRRYGFHGTSHRYVAQRAAEFLGKPVEDLRLITCHLGNGCSIAAINKGKSVDTSMGFTPLDGLMMGTRTGSIDPAILLYLEDYQGMSAEDINKLLNKESGLLGVSELSNDLRDVGTAAKDGNEKAQLAIDMYAYYAKRFIGSYTFAMGAVDAIVFTAGVGENAVDMRQMMLEGLEEQGIIIDAELNAKRGGDRSISADESAVKVLVIPTNEELMIAQDVKSLVGS